MTADRVFRALANKNRIEILFWLQNPRRHFPPQIAGDLVRDGVCGCFIAEKLRVSLSLATIQNGLDSTSSFAFVQSSAIRNAGFVLAMHHFLWFQIRNSQRDSI